MFRVAVLQIKTIADKAMNIAGAQRLVEKAVSNKAEICVLPEMWNCPFDNEYFQKLCEEPYGETYKYMETLAKTHGVYLVGGSIPIKENGKIWNTNYTFDPEGKLINTYRKCHLFDIDVPGQITTKESDVIGFGTHISTFNTKWCKIGLGICYDIRFPLQAQIMRDRGAKVMIYPAAFSQVTGPVHFEVSARARAIDNQCFFIISAPARNTDDPKLYQSYGNSLIVNPNGCVVSRAEQDETILYYDVDLGKVDKQRQMFPFEQQARTDLYKLQDLKGEGFPEQQHN